MMVKKELVEKVEKNYKSVEEMKDAKFYMEMADYIGDWDYYLALCYVVAKAENEYTACYTVY